MDARALPSLEKITYPEYSSFVASDCGIYASESKKFVGKPSQRIPEIREKLRSLQIDDKKICDEEIFSLVDYTREAFTHWNTALRNGYADQWTEPGYRLKAYWPNLLAVVSAMNKLEPLQFKGTVYRGVKKAHPEFLAQIPAGTLFVERSFMSTSRKESVAKSFGTGVLMEVTSRTGLDVSALAFFQGSNEEEILFKPGTLFKTVSLEQSNESAYLKIEEIENSSQNLAKAVLPLSPQGKLDPQKKPFPANYPLLRSILEQEPPQDAP